MISFKPTGRLGNFLFLAANCIAYAKKHNIEFSFPSETNDAKWNPIYLTHLANPKWIKGKVDVEIKEKTYFKYDDIEFKEEWRDKQILLNGYWQNPKYFQDYREDILSIFDFDCHNWFKHYVNGYIFISVHVRRGDYVTLREKHPEVTKEWYENAMKQFDFSKQRFIFFSDDIVWCKQEFGDRFDCVFVEDGSELTDLIKISQCDHHINSSSTFSWMGAWLNKSKEKIVITPKQWMTPSHSNQWTEEIIPKEWIKM